MWKMEIWFVIRQQSSLGMSTSIFYCHTLLTILSMRVDGTLRANVLDFTSLSDETTKENFEEVDTKEDLKAVLVCTNLIKNSISLSVECRG